MDRRKFFRMFTAGSVGLTAASKLALAEDLTKWMLSPQKTIFIPAPPKIFATHYIISLCRWDFDPEGKLDTALKQRGGIWVKAA